MRFIKGVTLALLLMAVQMTALAQSTVLQGGPWKPNHLPMYGSSGGSQAVVIDSGSALGGGPGVGISELGLTIQGIGTPPYANAGKGILNTNFCDFDAPTTNATGYHYLCLSPNAQGGGLLAYGAAGAATQQPFQFYINGQFYQFPFTASGVIGPNSSTVGHLACWNNTTGTLLSDCGASTGVTRLIAGSGISLSPSGGTGVVTVTATGGGSGITQLTGDITAGPGSGSQAATLATVNSTTGTFANPTITINGKGLITHASAGTGVTGPGSSTSGYLPQWSGTGGNLLGSGLPVGLTGNNTVVETSGSGTIAPGLIPASGVTAGSYTATNLTVGADGRITAAANGVTGSTVNGPGASVKGRVAYFNNGTGNLLSDPGSAYNAVAYGADSTGTIDSAAGFAAACTASGGSGTVYVPPGNYITSTLITTNCTFYGDGVNITTIFATSATTGIFNLAGFGNGISGIGFQPTVPQTAGYFVTMSGVGNFVVNSSFNNQFGGINITGAGKQTVSENSFGYAPGSNLHSPGGVGGVNIQTAMGVVFIHDNIMNGGVCSNPPTCSTFVNYADEGINIANAGGDTHLNDNEIISMGTSLYIGPGSGQLVVSLYASQNFFDNGGGLANNNGIVIAPVGTGAVARSHFIGNWTSSQTNQAFLINPGPSASVSGIDIIDHHSFGNTQDGLLINSATATGIEIIGGQFAGNLNGIEAANGASGWKVQDALIGAYGGFAANSGKDVVINAGSTNYMVFGNNINGNGIVDTAAVGIVTCNDGVAANACGSGSGGSGTVSSGTAQQLGYYATTGTTISGNANVTASSAGQLNAVRVNLSGTGNTIIMPTNGILLAGGVAGLSGDGAGHTFLGDISANGGTGVEVQNTIFPSVNNSFNSGGVSNRWATGYFTNINISGTCTGCSGSGTVSSGTVGQIAVYTGSTTVGSSNTPTTASMSATSNFNDGSTNCSGTACVGMSWATGNVFLGNGTHNVFFNGVSTVSPANDNLLASGSTTLRWANTYSILYSAGSGNTAGVSCSGSPTSSFAAVGGIVTHC